MFPEIPEALINAVLRCKRAVVCGHHNPDGDCLYSTLAMGVLLEKLGKDCVLVNDGPFTAPEIADYAEKISSSIPRSFTEPDTLGIMLDCSTWDRIESFKDIFRTFRDVVVIDHHANGGKTGNLQYVVPSSPATTLLVYKLYRRMNVDVTPDAAKYIFRGFATDSGFFSFLYADSAPVFDIVSDLVKHGVEPYAEYNYLMCGKTYETIRYLAALIERTETYYNGRLAVSFEKPEDSNLFGQNTRASDEYYRQMLSIRETEAVILFKISKKREHAWELGLRSSYSSNIDMGAFATEFGGGGHKKAAGATLDGSYTEIRKKVLDAFGKFTETC